MRDQQTPNSYLNVSDIFTFFNFFFDIFGIFPPSSKGKPIHQMQKEKKIYGFVHLLSCKIS